MFAGERTPDFGEAAAKLLDVVKPVRREATNTMKELQTTAQNLNRITDENSELNLALAQFKTFGDTPCRSYARRTARSTIRSRTSKRSATSLTKNDNIEVTLQNFRNRPKFEIDC